MIQRQREEENISGWLRSGPASHSQPVLCCQQKGDHLIIQTIKHLSTKVLEDFTVSGGGPLKASTGAFVIKDLLSDYAKQEFEHGKSIHEIGMLVGKDHIQHGFLRIIANQTTRRRTYEGYFPDTVKLREGSFTSLMQSVHEM